MKIKDKNVIYEFQNKRSKTHCTLQVPEYMLNVFMIDLDGNNLNYHTNGYVDYTEPTDRSKIYNRLIHVDVCIRKMIETFGVVFYSFIDVVGRRLEIHHLDGNKTNNTLENLMLLSHSVHQKTRINNELCNVLQRIRDFDIKAGKEFHEYFDIDEERILNYMVSDLGNCKDKIDWKKDLNSYSRCLNDEEEMERHIKLTSKKIGKTINLSKAEEIYSVNVREVRLSLLSEEDKEFLNRSKKMKKKKYS